jgi:hypothetical protein
MSHAHLLAFSLIVASLILGCGEPAPQAAARIELAESSFDAGRIAQGTRVDHIFALRNAGGHNLRITRVRTSCDCTATIDTQSAIPPGATAEIAASCDTTGAFGDITRTISVFTNDPTKTSIQLRLNATVDFDVAAKPRQLYVGRVRAGDTVKVQGRIVLGSGVQIARIDSGGPIVTANLVEVTGGVPGERRFQVRIAENAPAGEFTNELIVRTTSPKTPVLTVPVIGTVEGRA